MILNTTEETRENLMGTPPPLKISKNRKIQAIFRGNKLPQKNNLTKNTATNLQLRATAWSIYEPHNVLLN